MGLEMFYEYGEYFIKFLKESHILINSKKVLLLLDRHKEHLFKLEFMEYMVAHNVEVFSFPPHCTHVLKPLDNIPFADFKNEYQKALIIMNRQLCRKCEQQTVLQSLYSCLCTRFDTRNNQKGIKEQRDIPSQAHNHSNFVFSGSEAENHSREDQMRQRWEDDSSKEGCISWQGQEGAEVDRVFDLWERDKTLPQLKVCPRTRSIFKQKYPTPLSVNT